VTIKKKAQVFTHGGKRPGAGRPPSHNVQLLVRVKPATAEKLKELAGEVDMTPGQWLDQCLAAAGSKLAAHTLAILRQDLEERRLFSRKTAADLKDSDPKRSAQFFSMAEGLQEALRMLDEKLADQ